MTFEFDMYIENMLNKHRIKIDNIIKNNAGILIYCYNCKNHSFLIYKDNNKECECFVCENKISKNDLLKLHRKWEKENEENEFTFVKFNYNYNKTCSSCKEETRIIFSPSYSLATKDYESDYFYCINCLHYETLDEINAQKFKEEMLELERNHTPKEFIKILEERILKLEGQKD